MTVTLYLSRENEQEVALVRRYILLAGSIPAYFPAEAQTGGGLTTHMFN